MIALRGEMMHEENQCQVYDLLFKLKLKVIVSLTRFKVNIIKKKRFLCLQIDIFKINVKIFKYT